jgi:hypothetical protein
VSINADEPKSWVEYSKHLTKKQDTYARFIIAYVGLVVLCTKLGLSSDDFEVDITNIEKIYAEKYESLSDTTKLKISVRSMQNHFGKAGVKPLEYSSWGEKKVLVNKSSWEELGNAINYLRIVRNNLIHGDKNFDVNEHSRDYIVTSMALNILDGLFEDLFQ